MLWNAHCRVRLRAVGRGDKGVSSNSYRCILCSTDAQHNTTDDETRVHRMKFEKKRIRIQTVDMRARNESLNHCHLLRVQQRKSCQCGESRAEEEEERGKRQNKISSIYFNRTTILWKGVPFSYSKEWLCARSLKKKKKRHTHTPNTHTHTLKNTHTCGKGRGHISSSSSSSSPSFKKIKKKSECKEGNPVQCSFPNTRVSSFFRSSPSPSTSRCKNQGH